MKILRLASWMRATGFDFPPLLKGSINWKIITQQLH